MLENCEAMELHEVETMEILQVEEIEIVSAQVEDMNYLHRQKTEVLELEAEFEEPEQIQKVGTWSTERVASEVDNPLPTAPVVVRENHRWKIRRRRLRDEVILSR